MCGIFSILNNKTLDKDFITEQFNKSQHRGPDNSTINNSNNNFVGFHRLQINGLNEESNQPFIIDNIMLICNGEIYNYKQLYSKINYSPVTNSDCEIIIYLYKEFGIEYAINLLDGVFAFILFDYNINQIYIGRDSYGVRPLYYLFNPKTILVETNEENLENENPNLNIIGFGSEIKQLVGFTNLLNDYENNNYLYIEPVMPGEFMKFEFKNDKWFLTNKSKFNTIRFNLVSEINDIKKKTYLEKVLENIHNIFCESIKKRVEVTDRPIACLLSGGLDSSIVAALVKKYYNKQLETYSIGLEGSEDLHYAKIVAEYLGTKHIEIVVSEEDFFNSIPEVIYMIESFDTTTVRASVGNYLVSKYISENSDAKVIFNGDGSDELMGGYLYINKADSELEFDKECKNLIKNIHYFDVLRSDRCISTNGLEPRTPFLDRTFVDYYLGINSALRYESNKMQEKYLFRKAFDRDYLPKEILWRRKEAFSDGVSKKNRSWFEIIQEKVETQKFITFDPNIQFEHCRPTTMEQLFYRHIYETFYSNLSYLIPYFWMPKYVDANDASARTLEIYSTSTNDLNEDIN